jgi:hypothetical protein
VKGLKNENTSVKIIIANTSKEVEIGLGRNFPKAILKENQAIISSAALRNLGLDPKTTPTIELEINLQDIATTLLGEVTGGSITKVVGPNLDIKGTDVNLEKMGIDLLPFIKQAMEFVERFVEENGDNPLITMAASIILPLINTMLFTNTTLTLNQFMEMCSTMGDKNPLVIRGNFKIVRTVESPKGKWPDGLGKVMLIDDSYLLPLIINSTLTNLIGILAEQNSLLGIFLRSIVPLFSLGKDIKIEEFALTSQIVFKDRSRLYIQSKQQRDNQARDQLTFLATEVFGLEYRAKYELTLLASVDGISSFIVLLDVIFMLVTFFLMLLSILLIYSLMMSVFVLNNARMWMRRLMSIVC